LGKQKDDTEFILSLFNLPSLKDTVNITNRLICQAIKFEESYDPGVIEVISDELPARLKKEAAGFAFYPGNPNAGVCVYLECILCIPCVYLMCF